MSYGKRAYMVHAFSRTFNECAPELQSRLPMTLVW